MTQSDIINNNFSKAFECIKCSNAYTTGEVLSEEKLFKQISERRHSTFDLSKFTVAGSPTITDDGVASNLSQSGYFTAPFINFKDKTFSFKTKVKFNDLTRDRNVIFGQQGKDYILPSLCLEGNKLRVYRPTDGTMYDSWNVTTFTPQINTWYNIELIMDLSYIIVKINGDEIAKKASSGITFDIDSNVVCLGATLSLPSWKLDGSIDLKQFSITVDGKEVFSGNKTGIDVINDIEIPYTLSKTGSKIVDVAYRDRVIDLYEQQGQAGYYTIDEENRNFTLPMGEIYGMIGGSSSTGGSGLEVCDIGMALYVDETKGLRRYLNGQIVDRNKNTEAFFTRLQEITTLHPSLLCTEEEWQSSKTMSAFGQVGKFVFNYSGDEVVSVRLPRVVNVQGLFDLQNLGMTVRAGLPNITGSFGSGTLTKKENTTNNSTEMLGTSGAILAQASYGGSYINDTSSNSWFANGSLRLDASASNPIYGNSNTVQQEAIQYPYFIQIATGSETENNIINDIELNNPYSLFDSKYSDHELNNLSWLKSEGQWNAKAVYTDAYNELLREYNDSTSVEETEGSITFKRTPKGYKIALANQETAIDTKYATHGIAWYYILDTTNEKFKLPRTKFGFEGLRTSVGDDIAESLPNIKGRVINDVGEGDYGGYTGAISLIAKRDNPIWQGATNVNRQRDWDFNASRSSSTYKDGAPVQERATQMYLYFYVGETVQNANLIDAGRIGEELATKTDMEQAAKASMPSSRYIDLTLGASGSTYTAPANGYFQLALLSGTSIQFYNKTKENFWKASTSTGGAFAESIGCQVGDVIQCYHEYTTFRWFRFYYAEGSK